MGDPSGIGPEVLLKALSDPDVMRAARWIVTGDKHVLGIAERITGLRLENAELRSVTALDTGGGFSFGRLDARYGEAAVEYVRAAVMLCLDGEADAMVTPPLNKEAVALSGRPFSGHTEYIAELCGAH